MDEQQHQATVFIEPAPASNAPLHQPTPIPAASIDETEKKPPAAFITKPPPQQEIASKPPAPPGLCPVQLESHPPTPVIGVGAAGGDADRLNPVPVPSSPRSAATVAPQSAASGGEIRAGSIAGTSQAPISPKMPSPIVKLETSPGTS